MSDKASQCNSLEALHLEFCDLKNEQIKKAQEFENSNSYEMAYLSYWIILEKGLKTIDVFRKREKLYREICLWKKHLENSGGKQPSAIKNFSLQESEKIPDIKPISEFLGEL